MSMNQNHVIEESEPRKWQAPASNQQGNQPIPQRKTLGIKNPTSDLFKKKATPIEEISEKLTSEIKQILMKCDYQPQNQLSHAEVQRINRETSQALAKCIVSAYEQLKANNRYPYQTKNIFQNMINNTKDHISSNVVGLKLFLKEADAVLNPKDRQQNVPMASMRF